MTTLFGAPTEAPTDPARLAADSFHRHAAVLREVAARVGSATDAVSWRSPSAAVMRADADGVLRGLRLAAASADEAATAFGAVLRRLEWR